MVGNLTQEFDGTDDAPDSIEIEGQFAAKNIAIGQVYKIDNSRIAPTQDEIDVHYETEDAIGNQEKRYLAARLASISLYERYLDYADKHSLYEVRDIAVSNLSAEVGMISSGGTNRDLEPGSKPKIAPHARIIDKIDEGMSAEAALDQGYQTAIDHFLSKPVPQFQKMANEMEQHRAAMQHFLKQRPLTTLHDMPIGSVLAVENLTLDCLSHLVDPDTGEKRIEGIIVKEGSMKSHAAILAQALGIPYARISADDFANLAPSTDVVMDGTDSEKSVIHLSPSKKLREKYGADQERYVEQRRALAEKWGNDNFALSSNEEKVNVHVNYAMSHEAHKIRSLNPRGIGLYRTEMYCNAREEADVSSTSVKKHLEIMKHSMHICHPDDGQDGFMPMTIRTIDLDGDKSDLPKAERKQKQEDITFAQMKALVLLQHELNEMDAKYGHEHSEFARKLKVMVPNIRDAEHFSEMQALMDKAAEDVSKTVSEEHEKEVTFDSIKLGMMVENPAVLDDLDDIDASFFSIGTNDLWHSLYNVQRYDNESNEEYDPTGTSFLKTLKRIVDAADDKGIPVSICGNMASEIEYLPLLVGTGLKNLSAGAAQVDTIKELVSRIDIEAAEQLVEEMSEIRGAGAKEKRHALLQKWNQNNLGLEPDGSLNMSRFDTKTPSQIVAMGVAEEPGGDDPVVQ